MDAVNASRSSLYSAAVRLNLIVRASQPWEEEGVGGRGNVIYYTLTLISLSHLRPGFQDTPIDQGVRARVQWKGDIPVLSCRVVTGAFVLYPKCNFRMGVGYLARRGAVAWSFS